MTGGEPLSSINLMSPDKRANIVGALPQVKDGLP